MRHTLLTATLSGALLLGVSACDRELLTPIPQTSVSDASSFSTTTRVQGQLLSLYGALKDGNFYGGRYVVYGDIRGEHFINETSNLVTGADVWNLNATNSATAVQNLWYYAYLTINKCNIFLDGMAAGGTKVVGDDAGAKYIAEAKLIRGLSYYSLLQYYARPYADGNGAKPGVPLRLNGIKGTGQSNLARNTVAEVYTQVLKDLNEAEAALPASYATANDNTTRAHKNTAIALKTRVYLSMQDYANVVTEANKIVSATAPFTAPTGVKFALQPDITTVFTAPNYNTAESIFSMPMTTTAGDFPGTQNQLAYYYSPPAKIGTEVTGGVGNGEYSLNPNGIIANPNWTATDKRRSFIKQTGTGTAVKNWLIKYKQPSPFTDWVPVIRYAEVMLNLAEAKARTTNSVDPQAVALLNAVRNRSDAATTYTAASFATPAALINAILLERQIEFLGEGLRNNDLMRLLQTIPAKGSAPSKGPNDSGYIWPISATELSLNTLATDN
ncbi:RagB/SusD family nutrient uptake outer membrane protein [Fibrella aquatilis]|uniref:RagB/SusD family nutrient uptake outer membrane protein n=1 Tax=Fibrella aquatilis TaxID=2817059 RepID=A0A939G0R3_9BACT|nr:RagB/SusD family nutrient uptake outer membrane protein [Fibrella aquatilis]MBO0930282.1 RagB/SusD family nutrient uptake outer membrane protein [Fibrella aquatilis]